MCLFVAFCIRYGCHLECLCHFASGMIVSWPAILHQIWSAYLCRFAPGMVVTGGVCATLHQVWLSMACLCHFARGLVVNWCVCAVLHQVCSSVGMPFCIRSGRQLACLYVLLHQLWLSGGVRLCHFAPGMVVGWRVSASFCIRYGR